MEIAKDGQVDNLEVMMKGAQWTLWFNPACSKCRQALELLRDQGIDPTLRRYLEEPPRLDELRALAAKLNQPVIALIRTREPGFAERGLSASSSDAQLFQALVESPAILERPILETGERAVIARPPEKVFELLSPGDSAQ
jgi:arsenate reductase (glutaredoxin)